MHGLWNYPPPLMNSRSHPSAAMTHVLYLCEDMAKASATAMEEAHV